MPAAFSSDRLPSERSRRVTQATQPRPSAGLTLLYCALLCSVCRLVCQMYLLTGKQHEQYRRMYLSSIDSMLTHLYSHTPQGTAYIADMEGGVKDHKMDHLVCFVPGMLALGVRHGVVDGDEQAARHMDAAKQLMRTCYDMYHMQQPSGIGAEYSRFTPEMTPGHDASYKLRPETVESLFVLWRVTGDEVYREWGWEIWSAIDKHCRVEGGYAALLDVRQPERKEDKMESFFLAETLKYLYLLFADNSLIPIFPTEDSPDYFVFNTECHPIKVRTPARTATYSLPRPGWLILYSSAGLHAGRDYSHKRCRF